MSSDVNKTLYMYILHCPEAVCKKRKNRKKQTGFIVTISFCLNLKLKEKQPQSQSEDKITNLAIFVTILISNFFSPC